MSTVDVAKLRDELISMTIAAFTRAAPALVDAALVAAGILEVQPAGTVTAPAPEPTRMRVKDFAKSRALSAKTISRWCAAGMPHVGGGSGRRVLVKQADDWIAAGGAKAAAERAARRAPVSPAAH